ncbi:hypothetical protein G6L94_00710 [Agrobacterium rhizogenes]|uniref:hypothetical protein n=1 Tax=Rhizobium rhizogenes TaxID=359 RepID=UPI001146C192|nr:hypothetical protein [Rhizobium rhizogenes]NTI39784.1 hypothetical protein [Rhizobium rhizogenes]NTI46827.1 hypothetical protein [Rhizobium rhizogenes]NTI92141.1 hypothetical protein [Rhizobium rhizogenes]NTJ54666.1 hypothetical protein [Rhizobium rhizogenes]
MSQEKGADNGMEEDRKRFPGGRIPANNEGPGPDLDPEPGKEEKDKGGDAPTPRERLDLLVLDIARLLGRQIARDEFERQRARRCE